MFISLVISLQFFMQNLEYEILFRIWCAAADINQNGHLHESKSNRNFQLPNAIIEV